MFRIKVIHPVAWKTKTDVSKERTFFIFRTEEYVA